MRRLHAAVERKIFELWLKGDTYRQIQQELEVGLATISRVIEDARQRDPDIDELRKLCILLRKNGSNVLDAMRGAHLLDHLNSFNVSLDKLENYLKLTERLFSDEVLDEKILEFALKLTQLEESCGKPYEKIVKDFETKLLKISELEAEKGVLEEENETLKGYVAQAEENLRTLNSNFKSILASRKRLKEIGIDRLDTLAKFIQKFESLGFNVNEVKELAEFKEGLVKTNTTPNELRELIQSKSSLQAAIHKFAKETVNLNTETSKMKRSRNRLQNANHVLSLVDGILTTRSVSIPCKSCGKPSRLVLATKKHYDYLIENKMWIPVTCPFCRFLNFFNPLELSYYVFCHFIPTGDEHDITLSIEV